MSQLCGMTKILVIYMNYRLIGKYSFVNRSITDWNQRPEWAIGTSHGKTRIFKTRVRKVQNSGGSEGDKKQKVKAKELKGCEL